MFDLAQRVLTEPEVCKIYAKNRFVGGPGFNETANCDMIGNFCQMTAGEEEDKYFCQGQNQYFWFRLQPQNLIDTLANVIQNSWYSKKDGKPKKEIDTYNFN